jgi:hypothetical protein
MLETRGFTWTGFTHFCMDADGFFIVTLGSITPCELL